MFSCFWGKTGACSALSPPLPLCLSIFPSPPSSHPAAVFLSELESGAKLFFPLVLTASQAGTYRITDINKHRLFILFFVLFPWLALTWLLTVYWPHFGRQTRGHSLTWLLWLRAHTAPRKLPDYSEKCFHGKMSHKPPMSLDLLLSLWSVMYFWGSCVSLGLTVGDLMSYLEYPVKSSSHVFFGSHSILRMSSCGE